MYMVQSKIYVSSNHRNIVLLEKIILQKYKFFSLNWIFLILMKKNNKIAGPKTDEMSPNLVGIIKLIKFLLKSFPIKTLLRLLYP